MKTEIIHYTLTFNTTAADLYHCLMDERIHSSFTGEKAIIKDKEGEPFSVYDGYAEGKNIVLERGKKIVQTWRAMRNDWPETHESEVAFILTDIPEGCRLEFYHSAVPQHLVEELGLMWQENYWEPLSFYINRSID